MVKGHKLMDDEGNNNENQYCHYTLPSPTVSWDKLQSPHDPL